MYLRHRTICGLAPELSQLGKRAAQWYAPFHQSPFLFLIKSISLSLSQSKLSCSHILLICEIDEYQNSHDINPNPISPMLAQNESFASNHTLLWSTSLQPFAIVAPWCSKYQLTKYPNCICWKLWCVPVVSVAGFFFSYWIPFFIHFLKKIKNSLSLHLPPKILSIWGYHQIRVFNIITSTFDISSTKKMLAECTPVKAVCLDIQTLVISNCRPLLTNLEHRRWTVPSWLQSVLSTEHREDWYSLCQLEKREWIRI